MDDEDCLDFLQEDELEELRIKRITPNFTNFDILRYVEIFREPQQIIRFDPEHGLQINKNALGQLLLHESLNDCPIYIINAVGPYRTGKSTALNNIRDVLMLKRPVSDPEGWKDCLQEREHPAFKACKKRSTVTKGIWVSGTIVFVRPKHNLVQLLVQGVQDLVRSKPGKTIM